MRNLWRRIAWAMRHRRAEAELEFHRAERQAALDQGGMTPAEARAESRRAMGNASNGRITGPIR